MSWDVKEYGRPTGYFYLSKRVNGRAKKIYLGTGEKGLEAARQIEERRKALQAVRQEEIRLAPLELLLDDLKAWLGLLVRAHLIIGGWYDHHGQWRRRGQCGRNSQATPTPDATDREGQLRRPAGTG